MFTMFFFQYWCPAGTVGRIIEIGISHHLNNILHERNVRKRRDKTDVYK